MKKIILAVCAVLAGGLIFAQNSSLLEPTPETIGADSAAMALREINVDKFEREGSWNVTISSDYGFITSRLFDGNPAMKDTLEEDKGKEDEDAFVFRRKSRIFPPRCQFLLHHVGTPAARRRYCKDDQCVGVRTESGS